MRDTLTQSLLDKDYSSLRTTILKVVDKKLEKRIEETKKVVVDKFNGVKSKNKE